MAYVKLLSAAVAVLMLGGCLGLSKEEKDKNAKLAIDEAMTDSVPSTLKNKSKTLSKKNKSGLNNTPSYVMSPLEEQLKTYKEEKRKKEELLSMSKTKAREYAMRTSSIAENLERTEARIRKLENVIALIGDNPRTLDRPGATGSELAYNTQDQGMSGGFNSNELPALGQESPLSGGSMDSFKTDGDSSFPVNDLAPSSFGSEGKRGESISPWASVSDVAPRSTSVNSDGPEFTDTPGNVWKSKPIVKKTKVAKIVVCDSDGMDSNLMINLGQKDGVRAGMLYEVEGTNGSKNVLVITKVHGSNSLASVHPQWAGGGLKRGLEITRIENLP